MKPVPNQLPSSDPGPVRLALVGENPGPDEMAQGQPFVGKSGNLLNGYLAHDGLPRSSVFVGNVAQVRPPGCYGTVKPNEFHLFEWNGSEVQEGIAALREDLARFQPNCVLALGNATLHLFRHGNVAPPKSQKLRLFQWTSHVGTWRGSLFEGARSFDGFEASDLRVKEGQRGLLSASASPSISSGLTMATAAGAGKGSHDASTSICASNLKPEFVADVSDARLAGVVKGSVPVDSTSSAQGGSTNPFKCLGTYHPAATFREPSFAYPLNCDLKRAVAEARSPVLSLPRRDITWGFTAAEIEAKCECIRAMREPVGFDIEGGLGGLQCLSFALTPNDAFVIDLMGASLDRSRLLCALASVLEDPLVPKVCWNAAYERAVLQATHSITLRSYEDGMLAWWERFSELPKRLDFVASILTREPYWAEGIGWDKRTGQPKVVGPRFWRYNGVDSCVTIEIWQHPLIRAVVESRTPVAFAL